MAINLKVQPILWPGVGAPGYGNKIPRSRPDLWQWRVWFNGEYKELDKTELEKLLAGLFNMGMYEGAAVSQGFCMTLEMEEASL